ncbi:hypothetical protein [Nocardioides endophyticus]
MANERADAASTVAALAFGGMIAAPVGIVWALASWPDESTGDSHVVPVLGIIVAVAGVCALLAAVVAWAVRLGIAWSGLRDQIVHDVRHPPRSMAEPSYLDEDGR